MFSKKNKIIINSPCDGKVVLLENVPDEVFSSKMVGDGVAIDPSGSEFCAVADGSLEQVFRTNHAYSMLVNGNVEVLVHIGVNTVTLNGECFKRMAEESESVKNGKLVIEADLDFITKKDLPKITPVVVSNIDDFSGINYLVKEGDTVKKGTPLYEIII